MTENFYTKKELSSIAQIANVSKEQLTKIIENTNLSDFTLGDIEKLISQLDEEKKQALIYILNTVKESNL